MAAPKTSSSYGDYQRYLDERYPSAKEAFNDRGTDPAHKHDTRLLVNKMAREMDFMSVTDMMQYVGAQPKDSVPRLRLKAIATQRGYQTVDEMMTDLYPQQYDSKPQQNGVIVRRVVSVGGKP